jgi:hypothetical protein
VKLTVLEKDLTEDELVGSGQFALKDMLGPDFRGKREQYAVNFSGKSAGAVTLQLKLVAPLPKDTVGPQEVIITAVKAELTRDTAAMGKMDPYVRLEQGPMRQRTPVHENGGKNPQWNHQFAPLLAPRLAS